MSLPEATVDLWIADDGFGLFRGAHDAYSRPGAPATHCRWVFQLARGLAIVRDVVSGSGARRLELAWHLPARARIEATGPCADAVMVEGRPLLVILVPEGHGWEKATDEGWESPAYGQRTARPVLRFSRVTTLPAELVTVLDPGAAAAGLRGRLYAMPAASVETDEARVAAYRYDDDHAEHMVFYAAGAGSWRFSDFESDAEFLYCKLDRPTKRMARAIVVGGSRVAWRGKLFTPRDAAGEVWTWRQPMATATADGAAIPETHRERGP